MYPFSCFGTFGWSSIPSVPRIYRLHFVYKLCLHSVDRYLYLLWTAWSAFNIHYVSSDTCLIFHIHAAFGSFPVFRCLLLLWLFTMTVLTLLLALSLPLHGFHLTNCVPSAVFGTFTFSASFLLALCDLFIEAFCNCCYICTFLWTLAIQFVEHSLLAYPLQCSYHDLLWIRLRCGSYLNTSGYTYLFSKLFLIGSPSFFAQLFVRRVRYCLHCSVFHSSCS